MSEKPKEDKNSKLVVKTTVQILLFKEDRIFIAYCPSLDISGYGYTEKEAKSSFQITLDEFIEYTTENSTLQSELEKLGLMMEGSKIPKFTAPSDKLMLLKNKELENIIKYRVYKAYQQKLTLKISLNGM